MPRITVAPHTPALASDFNAVADQTIMTFPTAAARSSAIPTPTEGMHTYRTDANVLEVWSGSAWVAPTGGTTTVAKRVAMNVVAASGGQVVVSFTGFAAAPVVTATMEDSNNFNLLIAGAPTSSSANFFVLASSTGAPAADGYGVRLHVVLVGTATAGAQPVITSAAAP